MTAGFLDYECVRGEPFSSVITVYNPDNELASLSYWGSRMQVRKTMAEADYMIELSTTNGRISHNTENATISLSISSEDTANLSLGEHLYDLELFSNSERPATMKLVKGKFTVR